MKKITNLSDKQLKEFLLAFKKHNVLPVCESVLFKDGYIHLTDIGISVKIKTNINETFCINICQFIDVLETFEDFKIDNDAAKVVFKNKKEVIGIPKWSTGDFPASYKCDTICGTLKMDDVDKIIIANDFSGIDELREAMTNVYINGSDIVATDAHVLYFNTISSSIKGEIFLPKKVVKLIGSLKTELTVNIDSSYIGVSNNEVEIIWKKLNHKYPNYKSVIPNNFSTTATFKIKDFCETLKKAERFTNKYNEGVIVRLSKTTSTISSSDINSDKNYQSDISCKITGDSVESMYSIKLLSKCLKHINTDTFSMEINSKTQPAIINGSFLIMPKTMDN